MKFQRLIFILIFVSCLTGCAELSIRRVDPNTFEYAYIKSQNPRRRQKVLNKAEFIGVTSKRAYIEREIGGLFWDTKEVYWIPLKELPDEIKKDINLNNSGQVK